MSGVVGKIDLTQFKSLQSRIEALSRMDLAPLMDEIGATVESQTRRRLSEEKESPDGEVWPGWSQPYSTTRHGGHSLLEGDGDLVDSIHSVASADEVHVGSNLVYAAIHQFGGEDVGSNIPARPYLGLSADNLREIEAAVDDFLARVMT